MKPASKSNFMNFHDLKIIVGQIKRSIHCPQCKEHYIDEDIELIGGLGDEQTYFHANCAKCNTNSVINVTLHFNEEKILNINPARLGTAPRMGHVSSNEVLDMHNFLKDFDGNFQTLFKAKKKPKGQ